MIRTTTPTHILTFPFDPANADEIWVTYKQNNQILVERDKNEVSIDSAKNSIEYTLAQEETKSFSTIGPVFLQVKVRQGDTVMASDIKMLKVNEVLNDDLMGQGGG